VHIRIEQCTDVHVVGIDEMIAQANDQSAICCRLRWISWFQRWDGWWELR